MFRIKDLLTLTMMKKSLTKEKFNKKEKKFNKENLMNE
jgi:hypothetical protein